MDNAKSTVDTWYEGEIIRQYHNPVECGTAVYVPNSLGTYVHSFRPALDPVTLRERRPTHLSIKNGIRLFEEPLAARVIGETDAGQPGVHLEDRSPPDGFAALLKICSWRGDPLSGIGEWLQRVPRIVRALRLEDVFMIVGAGGHLGSRRTLRLLCC